MLIAILTQWVAAVAGKIIACTMFKTTVVLAYGRIIPTLQEINHAGLIIMVQLMLNKLTMLLDTVKASYWPQLLKHQSLLLLTLHN